MEEKAARELKKWREKHGAGRVVENPNEVAAEGEESSEGEGDDVAMAAEDKDDEVEVIRVTRVGKGKERERSPAALAGYEKVWGEGRCSACKAEQQPCRVNLTAIAAWRDATAGGKVFNKAPQKPSAGCARG